MPLYIYSKNHSVPAPVTYRLVVIVPSYRLSNTLLTAPMLYKLILTSLARYYQSISSAASSFTSSGFTNMSRYGLESCAIPAAISSANATAPAY